MEIYNADDLIPPLMKCDEINLVFLFRDLRQARAKLMKNLTDPSTPVSTIESSANEYIFLLQGLCTDTKSQGDSKLRKCVNFKWTNTISGSEPW